MVFLEIISYSVKICSRNYDGFKFLQIFSSNLQILQKEENVIMIFQTGILIIMIFQTGILFKQLLIFQVILLNVEFFIRRKTLRELDKIRFLTICRFSVSKSMSFAMIIVMRGNLIFSYDSAIIRPQCK